MYSATDTWTSNVVAREHIMHTHYRPFEDIPIIVTMFAWFWFICFIPFLHHNLFTIFIVCGCHSSFTLCFSCFLPYETIVYFFFCVFSALLQVIMYFINWDRVWWRGSFNEKWETISQITASTGILFWILCDGRMKKKRRRKN